jgi:hypothetical protein
MGASCSVSPVVAQLGKQLAIDVAVEIGKALQGGNLEEASFIILTLSRDFDQYDPAGQKTIDELIKAHVDRLRPQAQT